MAITQVGSTTSQTSGSSGTVTVTAPSGIVSGDVIIAWGCHNDGAITLPSGFSQIATLGGATTPNTFTAYVWAKTSSGSEPANYTFTGDTVTGVPLCVIVTAWRGVNTAAITDGISTAGGGNDTEPPNPAISYSATGNVRELYMRACRSTTAIPTFTNGTANWSELADVGDFSGGTVRYGLASYAVDFDTGPGTHTEPAITCSTTETDNAYIAVGLSQLPPADTDTGLGTETEDLGTNTFGDTDTGSGSESELISVPIANTDSGASTESEFIDQVTQHVVADDFNRADETSLNISSSGSIWTTPGGGTLGVVGNVCKKTS